MNYTPTPTSSALSIVHAALKADETLRSRGVSVVVRDRGDFQSELAAALAKTSAPVVILAADSARNANPLLEVGYQVIVEELAGVNRAEEGYMTAWDVAWRCVSILEGEVHRFDSIDCTFVDASGNLQVVAKLACRFVTNSED